MNQSLISRRVGVRNLSRDQITILLMLAIGVTGLLIVFLIPDPLSMLTPQVPMLGPQDWPGSYIGTEMFFTDNWRTDPTAPYSPFYWEEKRGFYQSLYMSLDIANASIDQTVVWFSSPAANAAAWNELDPNAYYGWPIIERRSDTDKPVSFLACNPDLVSSPPQCWYLASWGHWVTGVFFWRQSNEDVLLEDIHQLSGRIDRLLMSAPEEPCFWFLCTNTSAG